MWYWNRGGVWFEGDGGRIRDGILWVVFVVGSVLVRNER